MHQFCTHSDTPSKQNLEVIGGATTDAEKRWPTKKKKARREKPAVHFKNHRQMQPRMHQILSIIHISDKKGTKQSHFSPSF